MPWLIWASGRCQMSTPARGLWAASSARCAKLRWDKLHCSVLRWTGLRMLMSRAVEDTGGKARDSRAQDGSDEDICVVLACDLPWASASAVSEVVSELASDPNLNAVLPIGEDDIPQYLHGAWRLRCLPSLEAAFAKRRQVGKRRVGDAG